MKRGSSTSAHERPYTRRLVGLAKGDLTPPMTAGDIEALPDEKLLALSLERSAANHDRYTANAIAAQKAYRERSSGLSSGSFSDSPPKERRAKPDRSYYSDRYY